MRTVFSFLFCWTIPFSLVSAEESLIHLPEGSYAQGEAHLEGDMMVCDDAYNIWLTPKPEETLIIHARAGKEPNGLRINIVEKNGKKTSRVIGVADYTFKMGKKATWGGVTNPEDVTLSDGCLQLPWNLKYFIRPNPFFYEVEDQERTVKDWDEFPAASEHFFRVELRQKQGELEFWIDGRFVGTIPISDGLRRIILGLKKSAALKELRWEKPSDAEFYLPISLEKYARPGEMKEGTLSLKTKLQTIEGIPIRVVDVKDHVDVGLSRLLIKKGTALGDIYYSRSAFDGIPETIIFSVPRRQYIYAHLLCAVEDSVDKAPVITARLTRYCPHGRGDAIADTTVRLPKPGEKLSENVRHVGKLSYRKGARTVELPLYLISVLLKVGEIQDLLTSDSWGMWGKGDYFDFELTKGLDTDNREWGLFHPKQGYTQRKFKPHGLPSAVHILGLTLEESPVRMLCSSKQPGKIFYRSEKPSFQVNLTNKTGKPGQYFIEWTTIDFDGKETSGKKKVQLSVGDKKQAVEVPVTMPEVGWYGIHIRLKDKNGRLLVNHRNAFAILHPDTRKAGYESPYGTWWFGGRHGGTWDVDIIGPLFLRAGLRLSTIGDRHPVSEKDLEPYKVTASYIRYMQRRWTMELEKWFPEMKKAIEKTLEKFPHCDSALIFHEDSLPPDVRKEHGPGRIIFPPELFGKTPPDFTPEQEEAFQKCLWERAVKLTKYYREKYPQIKLAFGNTGYSAHLCAEFFRRKYPKEYIDYLGVEALAQTFIPEKLVVGGFQSAWYLKETARIFGYEDIPITACYEWVGRSSGRLGLKTQAEWYVRDCLQALAYGFHKIMPGKMYDVSNAYYHSPWGLSGLFSRNPMLVPKPSYAALAVLTQVLDCAKFVEALPTGTLSLYALEFDTSGGRTYALWAVRGLRDVTLRFAKDTKIKVIDIMGRESELSTTERKANLSVGTGALYVRSKIPIREVIPGKSQFPEDKVPQNLALVSAMDKVSEWEVQQGIDERLERPEGEHPPFRTLGKMELAELRDRERGQCIEVRLIPEKEVPDIVPEYAVLRLKDPVAVEGTPSGLGLWVKGNSGWGRIMWEFEDAKGERWLSCGRGGWNCDMLDWPGKISINFDGWNFLKFDLPVVIPEGGKPVGWLRPQWMNTNGDLRVDLPIKLTGIVVVMRRKMAYLDKKVTVANPSIRLKDLSVIY